uniref:Spc7 domain-containing protein n=1 Tax=Caenorhabditis tropicalis TaxID=1561998 RepID=A0A1I7UHD3_9PELO
MESLCRYLYEKGSVEMANQLCELKSDVFNQILFNRGELVRFLDKEARKEGKSDNAFGLCVLETDRLLANVIAVIGKMLERIDEKSGEEKWKAQKDAMRKGIPGFGRMEKTSAQEAADVRICSIDDHLTKSMEAMIRTVGETAPVEKARELACMKIQTFNQILSKRADVTRGVDKALREGKSINDAISSYSEETTILLNELMDAGSKILTESGEKKKEEMEFMIPIRTKTQYASVRTLLCVQEALHGELDKPFYLPKDMSANRSNIYQGIRLRVGKYQGMMMVEERKTWKQTEKLLGDDAKANVEPLLFEYQKFLFELVEKAKKEGLEWKTKWDEVETEKITVKKENVSTSDELREDDEKDTKEKEKVDEKEEKNEEKKVTTKQIEELKCMMTVMKEEMLQELNKKLESAKIEEGRKNFNQDYCRLEQGLDERNEEVKRLNGVVESLNKKQEETENELEEVKKDHKKEIEEIRKEIQTSSKDDRIKELEMELAEKDGQLKESRETVARYEKESREWKLKEQEQFERMGKNELELLKLMELTKKVLEAEDSLEKLADSEEEVKRLNEIVESLNKRLEEMCESSESYEKMTLEIAKKQNKTEKELEDVKKELKEAREELERMKENSGDDSSFDQLDDSDN